MSGETDTGTDTTDELIDELFDDVLGIGEPEPNESPPLAEAMGADESNQDSQEEVKPAPRVVEDVVIFDIETGPRPWEQLQDFFEPPVATLGEFDPASVKLGRLKDEVKIAEKIEADRQKHEAARVAEQAKIASAKQDFIDRAALSPITGEVLAIGIQKPGANPTLLAEDKAGDEAELLAAFWRYVEFCVANKYRLVGHNIHGFDLPFLIRRSWFHGVDVPAAALENGRWHPVFVDTMKVWGCANYRDTIKLDTLAAFLGCKRKSGSGADFAKLWHNPETHQEAIEYLHQDLIVTCEVAEAMGVF